MEEYNRSSSFLLSSALFECCVCEEIFSGFAALVGLSRKKK